MSNGSKINNKNISLKTRNNNKLLFEESELLNITKLYSLENFKYYFKNKNIISLNNHYHNTRSARNKDARLDTRNLSIGQRNFVYILPKLFNVMLQTVKCYTGNAHPFTKLVQKIIKDEQYAPLQCNILEKKLYFLYIFLYYFSLKKV